MAFEKITDTSLANKGVTGLPDVPGLSTAEMQAKFDELSRDVIIPKLNEIVDGLNGDEVGLSSKIENPETKEKDVIQNVVNAIYQIVKENSDKRHGHENKETLDKVTAELYDSITTLVSMFNGISSIDKTVTADDTKIPTSGAIVNYAIELGAGDMQKAVYDKNNTGIVDNAEKLGGVAPEEYLQKASLPDTTVAFEVAETRSNISTGEKVSTVFGKINKFFADLTAPAFAQMITTKEDLLATKVTGYVPDAKAVADGFADVNGKLNYKHMSIKDGMAGITIPGDWIEAYVDITFSLNTQYYFTFHLIRDNLLSTNKKYLQDYYSSENDRHNICLVASATGVKLESYTYCGQDIGQNCEMNLFYR